MGSVPFFLSGLMPLTTYKALKFNTFVQYLGYMYMAPVVDMVHLPLGFPRHRDTSCDEVQALVIECEFYIYR